MDEAISREAVIDMLDETKRIARQNIDRAVLMTFERVFDSLVNITNALPTIQPANNSKNPNNSDVISRQAAIKDAESWVAVDEYEKHLKKIVIEWLKEFPPAEPGTNLAEVGTDCISRQAALVAVKDALMAWSYMPEWRDEKILEAIAALPSAEPKTGKWILDRSGAYCCSECMEPCAGYVMMKPRDKFCKMCGSRNEVTE